MAYQQPRCAAEERAGREHTAQISRLEDEAERLRELGRLTPEREDSIHDRMILANAEYDSRMDEIKAQYPDENWTAEQIAEREA